METNRLRQFCLILETGSLSKAAELLGISHGGLSKSIAVLQDEMGMTLFQAQGRGLIPTDQGRKIYKQAQEILSKVDELKTQAADTSDQFYRVGVLEVFTGALFTKPLIAGMPEAKFQVLELNPGQIETAVLEDRIEVGFTYLPVTMEGLEHLQVVKFKFGIYSQKGAFKNMKVQDMPFVAPVAAAPTNPLGIKERDVWPDGLFPRKKKFQVNLLSTAMDLARNGQCAIYIPEFLAEHNNQTSLPAYQLEQIPFPSHFPRQEFYVYLVKRITTEENQIIKKLSSEIRKLCRS
ncbi:MAG: LysR family transcriptional regulator [Bdellovibrionota bacterium]